MSETLKAYNEAIAADAAAQSVLDAARNDEERAKQAVKAADTIHRDALSAKREAAQRVDVAKRAHQVAVAQNNVRTEELRRQTEAVEKWRYAQRCWKWLVSYVPGHSGEWDLQHETLSWDEIISIAHEDVYNKLLRDFYSRYTVCSKVTPTLSQLEQDPEHRIKVSYPGNRDDRYETQYDTFHHPTKGVRAYDGFSIDKKLDEFRKVYTLRLR